MSKPAHYCFYVKLSYCLEHFLEVIEYSRTGKLHLLFYLEHRRRDYENSRKVVRALAHQPVNQSKIIKYSTYCSCPSLPIRFAWTIRNAYSAQITKETRDLKIKYSRVPLARALDDCLIPGVTGGSGKSVLGRGH